jgi:thimet oligopeptidase
VKKYAIREIRSNAVIGYFFTDFIPRAGKYGHAAAFTLISGRSLGDGVYSQPVSAIVANFSPPTADRPSLLTHDEVETLFHEFGHIMHQTLTVAPYAYLSGSSTAQDFVEAPSQMLENWVWNAEQLNKISGHYKNPNRKLPAELVGKMLAAKDFNQGYHYSRQIMLGLTDLKMHMAEGPVDANAVFREVHSDTLLFPPIAGSKFMAGFGHMMGGYDAGYYGYIWSEVFAADMFTRFEAGGLENESLGRLYRDRILGQGAMQEPLELLTQFLGRAPNDQAFLKKLGL